MAIRVLGAAWMDCPEPKGWNDVKNQNAKQLYEEAAVAAMVETVERSSSMFGRK